MNVPHDPDATLAAWLDEGPERLPESVRRAIEVSTRTTRQSRHRPWSPWRYPSMPGTSRLALGAVAVMAVAVGGLLVINMAPGGSVGAVPSPAPSSVLSPSPVASPSASASAPAAMDISSWRTYTSAQYGFSVGHPPDWTEMPATRAWTFESDALDVSSPGMDSFVSPGGDLRVSTWSIPRDAGETIRTWGELEAWVADYCRTTANGPCTGIPDRAEPLCLEKRDCHPAVLVRFDDDVHAFFTNGGGGSDMTVVVVWRPEDDPSVLAYGGSTRLLEAFLSTMNVWRPSGPDNHP